MGIQKFSGYELLEVLGEGPRGTVYKARDPKAKRWVAVKLFHSLEIENAGKLPGLKHPHVADICDGGRAESQPFTVTEYPSGGTLKDHIRSLQSVGDAFPSDQILAATGRFQAGQQRLEALEAEALKKGYKYIAGRAAAARKKIPATAQNENRMTA